MARGPSASLDVEAPARVRGGLLYQARFHIRARSELKKAILVLDPGWLENMTVNAIEPNPINEASNDGRLTLELGHIAAGKSHLLFVYFQVNPTNFGHRSQNVALYNGSRKLLEVRRRLRNAGLAALGALPGRIRSLPLSDHAGGGAAVGGPRPGRRAHR